MSLSLDKKTTCPDCATEWAPDTLACPSCRRLVHSQRLTELAHSALAAENTGDIPSALRDWRLSLELLPSNSSQYNYICDQLSRLGQQSTAIPQPPQGSIWTRWGGSALGIGSLLLLAWKFKFVLIFILSKAKLLLLGLTKFSTVVTMFLSFGLYWTLWGWKFAAGIILSIYIHEMGHVAALRRLGIAASAPAFIPGLGAIVRLKQYPANPIEDARVGLAGPVWGLGAAVACYLAARLGAGELFLVLAKVGAWINLFNLLPLGPLDGGRAFRSMNLQHRIGVTVAMILAWAWTQEGLLLLLVAAGLYQIWEVRHQRDQGDRKGALEYAFLIFVLSWLATLPVRI